MTNPFHRRKIKGVSILREVSSSSFCFEVFCAKSRFSAGCQKLSGRSRDFQPGFLKSFQRFRFSLQADAASAVLRVEHLCLQAI